MLQQLIESLSARGVQVQVEDDHYFSWNGKALCVGHFTVRESRGQLYVSFIGLGNMTFTDIDEATSFLAQHAVEEAPEFVS